MSTMTEKPANFSDYWDGIDQELERYEGRPLLEPMPRHSNEYCTVYSLRLTSIGPYRLFGYYSVPHGDGPFPAMYNTPKYGSVNHVPDYNDRQRYVCLTLMHRGQRLADQPFAAKYPGLLTQGIDSPETYVYRGSWRTACVAPSSCLAGRRSTSPDRDNRRRSGADYRRSPAAVRAGPGCRADVLSHDGGSRPHQRLPAGRDQRLSARPSGAAGCRGAHGCLLRPRESRRSHGGDDHVQPGERRYHQRHAPGWDP